jgi:hypothetical protein
MRGALLPGAPALACALACALASPAGAQLRLLEAGIVCPERREGAMVPAPLTEQGEIRRIEGEIAFDLPDRHVPLLAELSFGIRVGLPAGAAPVAAMMRVTHPPMGPRAVTEQMWPIALAPGGDTYALFTFELAHEFVEGPWRFSVVVEGEEAVAADFRVGPPGINPRVEQVCLGDLFS